MAVPVDMVSQMLGSPAAKPWFYATCFLILLTFFFLFVTILMAKRTNGFRELRASIGGKRVCWFFDDTRTAEMKIVEPSAGIVHDDNYGDFLINEKGTYVDKRTRNIIMPFSSQLAMGGEVKHFQAADQLANILGDERELQKVAIALANGELKDERFDALRTSVNFSALKSFSNTMLPHNITAKINLEIAKRIKSYGQVNTKQLMWFVIIGIGLILLAAFVGYMVLKKDPVVINNVVQSASNMTGILRG
jgi:hypothetical protein